MENLQIIISLAGTALSLLAAAVTFLVKFVKSIRQQTKTKGSVAVLDAVAALVESAEAFKNYSGKEKKEYVLTKANQFAIANNISFDADAVSAKIEELVNLSKQVNKRECAADA